MLLEGLENCDQHQFMNFVAMIGVTGACCTLPLLTEVRGVFGVVGEPVLCPLLLSVEDSSSSLALEKLLLCWSWD